MQCSMGRAPSSPGLEGAGLSSSDAELCIPAPPNWGRLSRYTVGHPRAASSARRARSHDDTECQCVGSSPALPQHTQQQNPIPETSKSSQLPLPWQRQRKALPAFDVLICLKHAKCHSEAGELRGGTPDCPEDGRLQGARISAHWPAPLPSPATASHHQRAAAPVLRLTHLVEFNI